MLRTKDIFFCDHEQSKHTSLKINISETCHRSSSLCVRACVHDREIRTHPKSDQHRLVVGSSTIELLELNPPQSVSCPRWAPMFKEVSVWLCSLIPQLFPLYLDFVLRSTKITENQDQKQISSFQQKKVKYISGNHIQIVNVD